MCNMFNVLKKNKYFYWKIIYDKISLVLNKYYAMIVGWWLLNKYKYKQTIRIYFNLFQKFCSTLWKTFLIVKNIKNFLTTQFQLDATYENTFQEFNDIKFIWESHSTLFAILRMSHYNLIKSNTLLKSFLNRKIENNLIHDFFHFHLYAWEMENFSPRLRTV